MAEDPIAKIETRLKDYVFHALKSAPDSPAMTEVKATIRQAIADEIGKQMRASAGVDALLARFEDLERKVTSEIAEISRAAKAKKDTDQQAALARIEKELDALRRSNDGLRQAVGVLASAPAFAPSVQQAAQHSMNATRRMKWPRKLRWYLGFGALAALVVVLLVWRPLPIPPLFELGQPSSEAAAIRGSEQEVGWRRLMNDAVLPDALQREARVRLCRSSAPCDLRDVRAAYGFNRELALQFAMEAVAADLECSAEGRLEYLPDAIDEAAPERIAGIAACLDQNVLDPTCGDGSCRLPVEPSAMTLASKSQWVGPLFEWSLTTLGQRR